MRDAREKSVPACAQAQHERRQDGTRREAGAQKWRASGFFENDRFWAGRDERAHLGLLGRLGVAVVRRGLLDRLLLLFGLFLFAKAVFLERGKHFLFLLHGLVRLHSAEPLKPKR